VTVYKVKQIFKWSTK